VTILQYKIRFLTTILCVWGVVVAAYLFEFVFQNGEQLPAWLLGIPTGAWLVVFPPLPRPKDEADGA
jgi:hypothetical protein